MQINFIIVWGQEVRTYLDQRVLEHFYSAVVYFSNVYSYSYVLFNI